MNFKKIIFGVAMILSISAYAARDAFVEQVNSLKAQVIHGGLYIGTPAKDPAQNTLNKVTYVLGATSTINQASVAAGACNSSNTVTVTGAAVGDNCFVSPSLANANNDNLSFECFVASANTVSLKVCAHATDDADSDTYRFTVIGQGR